MAEGRTRMAEAREKMEQARRRFAEMEERIRKLEAEVERQRLPGRASARGRGQQGERLVPEGQRLLRHRVHMAA